MAQTLRWLFRHLVPLLMSQDVIFVGEQRGLVHWEFRSPNMVTVLVVCFRLLAQLFPAVG